MLSSENSETIEGDSGDIYDLFDQLNYLFFHDNIGSRYIEWEENMNQFVYKSYFLWNIFETN